MTTYVKFPGCVRIDATGVYMEGFVLDDSNPSGDAGEIMRRMHDAIVRWAIAELVSSATPTVFLDVKL